MTVVDRREDWAGPVPVPRGVDEAFWAATLEGDLLLQRCDCGHVQCYPRVVCTVCGAEEPPYEPSDGTGTIYTYTVCHIPGEPGFADRTPFVVAAVDLAEGPRLLSYMDCAPEDVTVGMAVAATFWRVSDAAAIPVFEPV